MHSGNDNIRSNNDYSSLVPPPSKKLSKKTSVSQISEKRQPHSGVRCKHCGTDVVGYRFSCVECAESDMCVGCEAAGSHADHYLLRVPAHKPHEEATRLVTALRGELRLDTAEKPKPTVKVKIEEITPDPSENVTEPMETTTPQQHIGFEKYFVKVEVHEDWDEGTSDSKQENIVERTTSEVHKEELHLDEHTAGQTVLATPAHPTLSIPKLAKHPCEPSVKKLNQDENQRIPETTLASNINTDKRPYSCNVCKKRFLRKPHLVEHERMHTGEKPFSCNVCKKNFSTKSHLNNHMRIHTGEKRYSCNICEKKFTALSTLNTHVKIHSSEKPYSCNICEKKFHQKSNLNIHIRTHTNKKPYSPNACKKKLSCSVCEKIFSRKPHLVEHERRHTGEKPYSCNVCEKKFSTKSHLNNHMKIHSGEKPYSCNICEKKFTALSTLNTHVKIHSSEKPYSCNICEKKFHQKSNLNIHMRIHTGEKPYSSNAYKKKFSCNVCEKKFSHKSHFADHVRIHTGEKPYSCNVCEKKFIHKSHLIKHIRIHTGEKPYSCNMCEKKFTQKSQLVTHVRIHTARERAKPSVSSAAARGRGPLVEGEAELLSRYPRARIRPLPTGRSLFFAYPQFAKHLESLTGRNVTSQMIEKLCKDDNLENDFIERMETSRNEHICEKSAHMVNTFTLLNNSNLVPFKSRRLLGFPCFYCGKAFKTVLTLMEHNKTHNKHELKTILETISAESFVVYADITDLKCTICNQHIKSMKELKSHLVTEHKKMYYHKYTERIIPLKLSNKNTYDCPLCGFHFETFGSIERHMNTHYGNHSCSECGSGFITEYRLKIHMKRTHRLYVNSLVKGGRNNYKHKKK